MPFEYSFGFESWSSASQASARSRSDQERSISSIHCSRAASEKGEEESTTLKR